MSHYSSESNRLMRQLVSVSLIASILFLTPFSVSLSVHFTHAEETASGTSSATSSDQSGGSAGISGDEAAASASSQSSDGSDTPDTSITSGSSTSSADVTNTLNTNDVTLGADAASSSEAATDTAATSSDEISSTTPLAVSSSTTDSSSSPSDQPSSSDATTSASSTADASVINDSTAEASTTVGLESKSGDNSASSTDSVAIKTGDVIANANLLNVVNTNLVNSYGELLALSNLLKNSVGQFDLRSLDFFTGSSTCAICGGSNLGSLSVLNGGSALLSNLLSAYASSGANSAASNGSTSISSGNAYAAGNLINFADNNLVDSKYLFMTYNNFGDMSGDIVFPNAETLLQILTAGTNAAGTGSLSLSNTGTANVGNDITTSATSGNNSFLSTGSTSPVLSSGTSSAMTNVLNLLNSNLVGGASMNLLFNVEGSWSGTIFGLPPGVQWKKTDHGFVLSYDTFENMLDGDASSTPDAAVSNAASTTIQNRLDIGASSGDNSGVGASGSIDSGDAYAAANVINVANTNMIGHNMFWAIINIFGDWSGDLSFGKPDLWIGGHADITGASVAPGGTVIYHFTVINNGDLPATGVKVNTDLGSSYLSASGGTGDQVETALGSIAPKESKSFDITANLDSAMPARKDMVTTVAKVTSIESDNNMADNQEQVAVVIGREPHHGGGSSKWRVPKDTATTTLATTTPAATSTITVTQAATPTHITASSTVDYSVTIYNDSNAPAYNAEFHDRIMDSNGNSIYGEVWDLGTIEPHEELHLSYSVFFKSESPSGIYSNSGYVTATAADDISSAPLTSNVSLISVNVDAMPFIASPQTLRSVHANSTTSTSSTALSSTDTGGGVSPESVSPGVTNQALAFGGNEKNLLASVFYATPSGTELTIATIILGLIAAVLMAIRRRRYA
jgi:hypothetical protein